MKIAILGATGLVGSVMLKVLEERKFPVTTLFPCASEKSRGRKVVFNSKEVAVMLPEEALEMQPDIALFSAGGAASLEWAPKFAGVGTYVIDNSSAWRMDPGKKLIVPEVNASALSRNDRIIANPNCSTIQMVLVLAPLHLKYKIKRIVVSTYQSVTGTGVKAVEQLMNERNGIKGEMAYPHQIDMNIIPHIDVFLDNGYTKEEMKMILETKKILGDDSLKITSTTVRIPVIGGHSESVNIEFENDFDLNEVRKMMASTKGIQLVDDVKSNKYPMPIHAHNRDEVFVGRIRRDESQPNSLNLWIVADNLRKGAATNAVQIAEYLVGSGLIMDNG